MKTHVFSHQQKGVGLIEVMVTVLLLSTSLLSLAVMQSRSLQYNHEAYLRSQANILAYDIIDRARANINNMGSYNLEFADAAPTTTSRADLDLKDWLTAIANALPSGDGQIACDSATRACRIELQWHEAVGNDLVENGDSNSTTFIYETLL